MTEPAAAVVLLVAAGRVTAPTSHRSVEEKNDE
jgi:hypothetical protein